MAAQSEDFGLYSPPPLPKDPNLSRVAMLRLWYVGGAKAQTITLAKGTLDAAAFLEGNLGVGVFSPYVPMRPEKFVLHILKSDLGGSEWKNPALKEMRLAEPVSLDLKGGTFTTLVIREQNGVLTTEILRDVPLKPESMPVVMVKNYSGGLDWRIRLLNPKSRVETELWKSSMTGTEELGNLPIQEDYHFAIYRKTDQGFERHALFETKLPKGSACAIVLYPGLGGIGAVQTTYQANLGSTYNPARIKAIASQVGESAE